MNDTLTLVVNDQINVRQRLQQLCEWQEEWKKEDSYLAQRIQELSDTQLGFAGGSADRVSSGADCCYGRYEDRWKFLPSRSEK